MTETLSPAWLRYAGEPDGCAFIIDGQSGNPGQRCTKACKPGSSYCERHHALCHLSGGSAAETRRLKGLEALAHAVGGRCGSAAETPPPGFLVRVERLSRDFF
jgi:hypothetical protein